MALPKKSSRLTHLHSKAYRYLIKFKDQELSMFIQEDCKNPGNPLVVDVEKINIRSGVHPEYAITPKDVSVVIGQAMILGWEPSKKGPICNMRNKEFGRREERNTIWKSIYKDNLALTDEAWEIGQEAKHIAKDFLEKHSEYNPIELIELLDSEAKMAGNRMILKARFKTKIPDIADMVPYQAPKQ